MTKSQTSVYLRDEQIETIAAIARESRQREDVPDLSKSEVHRKLLDAGIEEDPTLSDLIPEHRQILHQRERFIDGEVKLQRLRTGFEGRCKRTVKKRFKQGIRTDELDRLGEGLKRDARILWPEDDARRREATDYVDALITACRDAIEASDYDPLDPQTIFEGFGTVAEAVEEREAQESGDVEELRAEARRRIERDPHRDLSAMATALARQHDVSEEIAEDVIEDVGEDLALGPVTKSGSAPSSEQIESHLDD